PGLRDGNDARTGMPSGIPEGAICVQRFDDSRNSAIHITYRISLRSSSMPEPRDPLLKVLNDFIPHSDSNLTAVVESPPADTGPGAGRIPLPGGLNGGPAEATRFGNHGWRGWAQDPHSIMILPQVHLRKPCYDFYFL